jgi:HAD superfamily hydrolase (TIGR01662 family)
VSHQTPLAVTFDFGQTLASFDTVLAASRLAERGLDVEPACLGEALPFAWQTYNDAIHRGMGGHPWKILMRSLLERAAPSAPAELLTDIVDFLWDQQPVKNLWRKPIPGMIELVDDLITAGIKVAVVSNSEGKLAELIAEMGWADRFAIVADSGKLGIQKPDRAIFEWAAERIGVDLERIVHIGDSRAADVEGALAAGMKAIWFDLTAKEPISANCRIAYDAPSTRTALADFGVAV